MKKYLLSALLFSLFAFPSAGAAAGSADKAALPKPKVLVIYFSLTGNTERVARHIQSQTGADLYRIETVNAYPTERPAMTEVPKRELESGNLPALKNPPPDLSGYDLIIVGSPVWWYTVSTPLMSFLRETDFQGKPVAPFCTHGGGIGDFFEDFRAQAQNAQVIERLPLWGSKTRKDEDLEEPVRRWLGKVTRSLNSGGENE